MNFGKEDLINGNITGAMLRFAFPLMLGNLLQQCYNIADTLIVGRVLGADALAAVGSSYALIVFVTSVFIGLCMGCSAVFSMQYGSNDFKEMRRSIFSSIVLVGGVTLFLNVCSLVFLSPIIRILQTPPEVERMVHDYLLIIFLGMIPVCVYNFYAFLLRAVGNSVVPLVFLIVSVVLNIVLDVLMMVTLDMGVEGAALATVISQIVGSLGLCLYTYTGKDYIIFIFNWSTTVRYEFRYSYGTRACKQFRNSRYGSLCSCCKDRFLCIYACTGFWKRLFHIYSAEFWGRTCGTYPPRNSYCCVYYYGVFYFCFVSGLFAVTLAYGFLCFA